MHEQHESVIKGLYPHRSSEVRPDGVMPGRPLSLLLFYFVIHDVLQKALPSLSGGGVGLLLRSSDYNLEYINNIALLRPGLSTLRMLDDFLCLTTDVTKT